MCHRHTHGRRAPSAGADERRRPRAATNTGLAHLLLGEGDAGFRAQVREDAKRVALAQIADEGPGALSVNAIGRELGMSGPALYRYFANRDALLTALVLDAYADLAAATSRARSIRGFAAAYRGWAREHPHRYRLLYAEPTPGYDAHAPELVAASQVLMAQLEALGVEGERAVRAWWRIHGFVSLEIEGNFASMGLATTRLFDAEVRSF